VLADDACDRRFTDFPALLGPRDVLVVNETRVIRARLRGRRSPSGGSVELLLLRPVDAGFTFSARRWFALLRPARRLTPGSVIELPDGARATVVDVLPDGPRIVAIDVDEPLESYLERHGEIPLPPYVGPGRPERAAHYQTVFARVPGSVAAPTASLHFTPAILTAIRDRGVTIAPLVLDVGIGTFRPIAAPTIDEHVMHAERYVIPPETVAAIATARARGGRIVAAGTTVLRALEGAAVDGPLRAGAGETRLYVTPGFAFTTVDALLTNFHLPKSTLLVLVSAFAGYDRIMNAYAEAIARGYRFFSFGDAMFVERNR